jgi:hypothetical protein
LRKDSPWGACSTFRFPRTISSAAFEAGNERPIDGAIAGFKNHDVERTLNDGWMSTGPGALIVTHPMHDAARNQMFASGRDPFLFSVPRLWDKQDTFNMLTRNARMSITDLGANLSRFRDRYARILSSRRNMNDDLASLDGDEDEQAFRLFHDRFHQFVAGQLRRTDALIADYERLVDTVP